MGILFGSGVMCVGGLGGGWGANEQGIWGKLGGGVLDGGGFLMWV